MTIGIYSLAFDNYNNIYIGQSINIEIRVSKHLSLLKHNKHYNHKLTNMYNFYGCPIVDIIEICEVKDLTSKENEWIEEFDSFNNGLNLRTKELMSLKGPEHSQAKFSKDQIIEAFKLLLDPENLTKDIEYITGVSAGTISMIASGKCHRWLEVEFSEEYAKLLSLIGSRRKVGQSARGKGRKYPPIKSPDGTVYTDIPVLKHFAQEHNLNYPHLCQLLNKRPKHQSVNGWTLA